MTTEARVAASNAVIALMSGTKAVLSVEVGRGVVVSWGNRSKRWVCRPGQDFYPTWSRSAPWGGTQSTAISQLVRWIRGLPVLPMATWEYWSSEKVKLCKPEALAILRSAGYPEEAVCVLCGKKPAGLDWWHLDNVSGPCCSAWNVMACRNVRLPKGGAR